MGVTTDKKNKPFNPRGNDQSPLAYNRAKLYSGKALDFDGANDYVDLDGFTMAGNIATISFHLKADDWDVNSFIFAAGTPEIVIGSTTGGNNLSFYDSSSWQTFGAISDTTSTNFFSIVFSGTSAIAYMNGVKFGNTLTITPINISSVTGVKLMSKYTGDAFFFNGQIAGFKIFNTALTAAQVADLYNNPEKVVPTGVDNTALKLWLPMQEGAGTTAINGAPDALGSELVTNGTFDTDSDWTKGTGTTISGGKANFSNAGGVSLYQNIGTQSGKVQVSFNVSNYSSGTLNVYSGVNQAVGTINVQADSNGFYSCYVERSGGNVNIIFGSSDSFTGSIDDVSIKEVSGYGTISGATWTHGIGAPVAQTSVIDWNKRYFENVANVLIPQGLTSGRDLLGNLFENVRKQGALNLDGNSWAEVHDNESLDMTTTATMEVWINADELDGLSHHIFVKSSQSFWTGNYGRYVLRVSETNVNWWFDDFTSNSKVYSISLSGWNHLAVTKDGTAEKLYINGALVDTETGAATFTASTFPLLIGSRTDYGEFFKNQLAQPRIYNRALTAEEVARNYNNAKSIYTNS